MEFTTLELCLGGGFISTVTAVFTQFVCAEKYVTRREFESLIEDMREHESKFTKKFNILFEMSRTTVQFLPLSARDKAKILNATGDNGDD